MLTPKAAETTADSTVQANLLPLEGPSLVGSSLVRMGLYEGIRCILPIHPLQMTHVCFRSYNGLESPLLPSLCRNIMANSKIRQTYHSCRQAPGNRKLVLSRPDHSLVSTIGLEFVGLDCVRLLEESFKVLPRRSETVIADEKRRARGLTVYGLLTKCLVGLVLVP